MILAPALIFGQPLAPPTPAYPPTPPACQDSGGDNCEIHVGLEECSYYRTIPNVTSHVGAQCLTISKPYYLAFVAGTCYDNNHQQSTSVVHCFDLTSGDAYYGKWVSYYASTGGIVLSAATKTNFMGTAQGYINNNAPPAGSGEEAPMPSAANATVLSMLANCTGVASAGLCPFTNLASMCACACDGTTCPDPELTLEQISDAAMKFRSTHLVIPVRHGFQFQLTLDAAGDPDLGESHFNSVPRAQPVSTAALTPTVAAAA
eukprot:CAMPEP_0174714086 /NCGR_PEP_ID=MMETSP1094-20130205/16526_1 /TAXON_ID=156173 /ORGANISM="Chrysochromulina brevifilum, Strain UTEX LB 985" /LENGTH=260 /DNA_ID=CAMNT_0015913365 /DNA_START=118 /DNA_END=895 /DNA_ORIENTATION=+